MDQILTRTDVLSISDTLKTMLIGLAVVFFVLAILIAFMEALHALFKDRTPKKKPEKRIAQGELARVPSAREAQDDPEFLAALSAVIAASTGTTQFVIRSVSEKNT